MWKTLFLQELDAIQTRVLEMDESDMQYEVERQFPYSPQAGEQPAGPHLSPSAGPQCLLTAQ